MHVIAAKAGRFQGGFDARIQGFTEADPREREGSCEGIHGQRL
jgi:hypothetical protein